MQYISNSNSTYILLFDHKFCVSTCLMPQMYMFIYLFFGYRCVGVEVI